MKYLFLDDERIPSDVTWIKIANTTDWQIVRSFNAAVSWVQENGFPEVISFDHDLGYEKFETTDTGLIIVTDATEEKSGYDFAKFLIEYDIQTNSMPLDFKFTVHSMNPIGSRNIQSILDNYISHKRNS